MSNWIDSFVLCMYTLLQCVLYRMYMHSPCGPVIIPTSFGKGGGRLVKCCCCLLLVLQDVCCGRSEEVGMAVLGGGRCLNRLLGIGVGGGGDLF